MYWCFSASGYLLPLHVQLFTLVRRKRDYKEDFRYFISVSTQQRWLLTNLPAPLDGSNFISLQDHPVREETMTPDYTRWQQMMFNESSDWSHRHTLTSVWCWWWCRTSRPCPETPPCSGSSLCTPDTHWTLRTARRWAAPNRHLTRCLRLQREETSFYCDSTMVKWHWEAYIFLLPCQSLVPTFPTMQPELNRIWCVPFLFKFKLQ